MNFRTLGRTGLRVSELGFGAVEIGRNWPLWRKGKDDFLRPSEADAIRVLHLAVDHGVNFFDSAPAYFKSEEFLGKAFKGIRHNLIIATKCGEWFDGERSIYDYSAKATAEFIESSLRQLQTDYVDLLQIHSASADVIRAGETLGAMRQAQRDGKVRFIGISTDSEDAAQRAIESGDYDSIQVSYNLLKQGMSEVIFPLAQRQNIGIVIKDGVGAGRLTPKYSEIEAGEGRDRVVHFVRRAADQGIGIHELALRFVLSSPAVSTVIVGTRRPDHIVANAEAAARGPLSSELLDELLQ